jgi:hypothetical protein
MPARVGVEVKLGTAVIVGVWLGVVMTVGVEVSTGGGGTVGETTREITLLKEQALRANRMAIQQTSLFITQYSITKHYSEK